MPFKVFQLVALTCNLCIKCPYVFIQNNVTISVDCADGQDINYELSYTTDSGTLNTTCVVDRTDCSNGICHHELQNNSTDSRCQPPVSQLSGEGVTVSVAATNIVGRSNSSPPVTISEFGYSNFHCSNLSHFALLRSLYSVY